MTPRVGEPEQRPQIIMRENLKKGRNRAEMERTRPKEEKRRKSISGKRRNREIVVWRSQQRVGKEEKLQPRRWRPVDKAFRCSEGMARRHKEGAQSTKGNPPAEEGAMAGRKWKWVIHCQNLGTLGICTSSRNQRGEPVSPGLTVALQRRRNKPWTCGRFT